jgi:hypothetical protein
MTQISAAGVRLVLEDALTMRNIETVHATLREAVDPPSGGPGTNISIDCSAATETDLAFVQLLIATRISTHLVGKAVSLAACPDGALLDTLTRGGFQVVRENATAFWFEGAGA